MEDVVPALSKAIESTFQTKMVGDKRIMRISRRHWILTLPVRSTVTVNFVKLSDLTVQTTGSTDGLINPDTTGL